MGCSRVLDPALPDTKACMFIMMNASARVQGELSPQGTGKLEFSLRDPSPTQQSAKHTS